MMKRALSLGLAIAAFLCLPGALAGTPLEGQIGQLQRENERLRDKLDRLQDKQDDAIRQAVQDRSAVQEKLIAEASKNIDKQGETINRLVNLLQLGLVLASLALAALTFLGLRVIRKWLKDRIDEVVTVELIGNLVHSRGEEAIRKFVGSFEDRINCVEHDLETLKRLPTSAAESPTPEQAAAVEEVSQSAKAKQEDQRTFSDWFALGLANAKAKRLDEARIAWEEALKLRPRSAPVIGNLALIAKNQGRLDDAESLYKQAIEADQRYADNLGNYAHFLAERERFDEAEALYKRAIQADPKHARNLGSHALFLVQRGHFDEAEALYKRAIEADPRDAAIVGNYAIFLQERNRFDEAEAFHKRAIEADPMNANNLGNYAVFLKQRERLEEAEAFYKRAIKADPMHANSLGNYAAFLGQRERFDEAESFFKQAIEADPMHANNLGNYAVFLRQRERFDEAEAFHKRSIDADPKNPNSLGNYAIFLQQRQRFDEAEAFFKQAIAADPKHANNLGNYSQVLFERGDDAAALIAMRTAMETTATSPALLLELNFYRYAHCPEEGDDALKRIKQLIAAGARSKGWDLSRNIERARRDKHPQLELLEGLADVIAERSPSEALEKFAAWKAA